MITVEKSEAGFGKRMNNKQNFANYIECIFLAFCALLFYLYLVAVSYLVICILDYNEPYREHIITSQIDFYHFVKCVHLFYNVHILKLEIHHFCSESLSMPVLA